jgi:hypothetical protein
MAIACPRCRVDNPTAASFCRHCGLGLARDHRGVLGAGRAPHPAPLPCDAPARTIGDAANLHYRWEAVGGGAPLLGTEPLELSVFNGGYDLADVVLRVCGLNEAEHELFSTSREIPAWARGAWLKLEIPSWELPDLVHALSVALVSAAFPPES